VLSQVLVGGADGRARSPVLERQTETDQAKRRPDPGNLGAGVLGAVRVDQELMVATEDREVAKLEARSLSVEVPAGGRRIQP
jgi:hypothetical protein